MLHYYYFLNGIIFGSIYTNLWTKEYMHKHYNMIPIVKETPNTEEKKGKGCPGEP
uniref:Uncharacterized protein n=1 Tax=viral metagenome TaxID=1070528 RepID=A0A6C0KFW4_9ZZZZ